jgi:regulator of RNase E activity RraA
MRQDLSDEELLELLKEFDTPSITNVIATYPHDKTLCLGLYEPWSTGWYTDQSLRCLYPELGRMVGYAVTAVFGLPDPGYDRLGYVDVLRAVAASKKPVVCCFKQDFPEDIKKKNGLSGGNMATAVRSLGAVAILSDGPSRDVDEVRELGIQYMLTGVCAGHGPFSVKAIDVPVSLCGMDVASGEVIHMDENGAVKFPQNRLKDVYERACSLRDVETRRMAALASTNDLDELIRYWAGQGY